MFKIFTKPNKKHLFKLNLINLFIIINIVLFGVSCEKTDAQKKAFIQKNIKKTNEKIAQKHGKLIIPDFLNDENVLTEM